jgi:hypothetical protein
MDRVASEFLPPLILDERRRDARRQALLVAVAAAGDGGIARRLGRALVGLGQRLQRGDRPPSTLAAADVFDLCRCGD